MGLRVPKLLPCVWVISVAVPLSSSPLCCRERFQDAEDAGRVVWAMFAISPTDDSVLFDLNSDSASKLSLTYKNTANKPTWDSINFK